MKLSQPYRAMMAILRSTLLLGAVLSAFQMRWLIATVTMAIFVVTMLPAILGRRFNVKIPAEFELLAVVFVYASLFLGELHGYYILYWWWDAVLHMGSGFLLGVFGVLLVYVLNERPKAGLDMQPGFIAFFAFMFAIGMGALWEIFEFAMDQSFGMNMQKSGLQDTRWDLIVNTFGAAVISVLGWGYLRTAGSDSFLERWISKFVVANPRLFRLRDSHKRGTD